ncbi:MAG: dihydrolipoyl dehydrogenase [Endomicrobiales bacterium]|nr:dihydrolipoyl dehydrogenase [Endomicrobiales bacterium]
MENHKKFDIIVIGAGPAGYSAAVRAAQLGSSVLLVERASPGGTCLNIGCVPTKFLWEATQLPLRLKKASWFGIEPEDKSLDSRLIFQKKTKNTELLAKSLQNLISGYNIELAFGNCAFLHEKLIEISMSDGTKKQVTADKVIIAAGSSPKSIPGMEIDHIKVIDSTDALLHSDVPGKMLVIGGGAIGIELGLIYSRLGSEITIVEKEPQILPNEDTEIAQELKKILTRQGLHINTGIDGIEPYAEGQDRILVAVGRKANISGLNLGAAKITYTTTGISVNEYLETTTPGIFAAGDVTGKWFLAYTAQAEGITAAENALGQKNTINYDFVPRVVFTDPPCASVGIPDNKLAEGSFVTGRFPFTANSRAFIEGERAGFVKITAEKSTGKILAGHIIGPHAEDMISILCVAMKAGLKIHDISREIFFHPSLAEALHCACEDVAGKCVDLPKKN